ncbi:MAG: hypothetical protein ABIS20_25275 [Thermoanaerobaculia bacterium]
MAFKSEELVLALITEDGDLIAARSCGGTQHECDALAFDKIVNEDKENLKILKSVLESTLAVIKSKERALEGRST